MEACLRQNRTAGCLPGQGTGVSSFQRARSSWQQATCSPPPGAVRSTSRLRFASTGNRNGSLRTRLEEGGPIRATWFSTAAGPCGRQLRAVRCTFCLGLAPGGNAPQDCAPRQAERRRMARGQGPLRSRRTLRGQDAYQAPPASSDGRVPSGSWKLGRLVEDTGQPASK